MSEYVFCNIEGSHFKVWGYECYGRDDGTGQVITYYGKIGLPMDKLRQHERTFPKGSDAVKYIRDKIDEKTLKGYVAIPNAVYFGLVNPKEPLSILVLLIEKYKQMAQA